MTQSIVINLNQLKALMLEFVATRRRGDDDEDLMRVLTLSDLLLWLREKVEKENNERQVQ